MRASSGYLGIKMPLIALMLTLGAVSAVRFATPAGAEYNVVYAGDCATPQSNFYLGDTVCASIGDFDLPVTSRYRRFQWVAPDGHVFEQQGVKLDPQSDTIILPTTGAFAQYGTWSIRAIDIESQIRTIGKFKVHNREYKIVDLGIIKDGPAYVLPGDLVKYTLTVSNFGPDDATSVSVTDNVPSNMTFYAIKQTEGRAFFECSTPARGETGQLVCSTKGLVDGDKVSFDVYYVVNRDAVDGWTCAGVAEITSRVAELDKATNYSDFEATVSTAKDSEDTGGVEDN